MMRANLAAGVILLMTFLAPISTVSADKPPPPRYVVIVNASNVTTTASRKFVGDAFLKKTTRWPNGDVIRPVDQAADSAVRRHFTEDVLKRSVAAVQSYWQQIVFSGRGLPPPDLASNEEVVKFVSSHAEAIGYVDGTASVGGVKVIGVE
jgi:ABC-type phosphate transport system substrate-binding protein